MPRLPPATDADGASAVTAGPARGERPAPASLAVVALVMSLGLYRFAHTLADPDIWGHIAIGRLYHETSRIRQPDPFSDVTTGHEWLNFEWLFELMLFRVFAGLGPPGLIVLKVAVGLLLLGYRLPPPLPSGPFPAAGWRRRGGP